MKILVTGGAGFIASHVADAFIEEGHDVIVLDDLSTGFEKNINAKARFLKMNICDPEVDNLFGEEQFDVVNHHAAQMDVRKSVADPAFDANVNILGTINLLQSSVKHGIRKFMFSSTGGAVYGEQLFFPANESHQTNPVSPYGISKLSVEKYLNFYHKEYNLNYTILRYANVYGPRQNPFGEAGVVSIFCNKMLSGEQPIINGDGKQTRDYVYVQDVVKANLLTLAEAGSSVYNVGTAIETNVNELFSMLNDIIGNDQTEKHGPAAPGEQLRSVITSDKLFENLDWKPSIKLEDGLKYTVSFFETNLSLK
ncbi:MAG: NAD-dependent epimerase/dehydratase family protein [Ignavibacterium sp.]|nr:MAG: NAD-dependent epimerase/dehydratase family protein [Ignavibacterium sp.]